MKLFKDDLHYQCSLQSKMGRGVVGLVEDGEVFLKLLCYDL
jgi:hypothetical protein